MLCIGGFFFFWSRIRGFGTFVICWAYRGLDVGLAVGLLLALLQFFSSEFKNFFLAFFFFWLESRTDNFFFSFFKFEGVHNFD